MRRYTVIINDCTAELHTRENGKLIENREFPSLSALLTHCDKNGIIVTVNNVTAR